MAKKVFKMTPAHEKFCQHYSEYGNATQAYLYAFPSVTYKSARELGSNLLTNIDIAERIDCLKEEFAVQYNQTKEGTIRDLIQSAEEAKAQGQFTAYAKLREMIIKMTGFYMAEKVDVTSQGQKIVINLNLNDDDDQTPEDKPDTN